MAQMGWFPRSGARSPRAAYDRFSRASMDRIGIRVRRDT